MPPLVSPLRSRENRLELEEESLFKMEEELKWGDGKIPEAKGVKLDKIFESEERKNCSWSSNLTSFCTPAASRSKARLHHPLSLSNSRLLIAFSFALPLSRGVYLQCEKSEFRGRKIDEIASKFHPFNFIYLREPMNFKSKQFFSRHN